MLDELRRRELRDRLRASASEGDATAAVELGRELLASPSSNDVFFAASIFNRISDKLNAEAGLRSLRVFVARSVTIEPVLPWLNTQAVLAGYRLEVKLGGFGSYIQELVDPQSELDLFRPDLVLLVLDFDDIGRHLSDLCAAPNQAAVEHEIRSCVDRIAQMLSSLRARSRARILLQGFVTPDLTPLGDVGDANVSCSLPSATRRLNEALSSLCSSLASCVFFDVDRIASRHGRSHWRDPRLFHASRVPLAATSFLPYARGLVRTIRSLYQAPRKVLCTDLDNTLWGGILGEDGPDGIVTGVTYPGSPFYEYQQWLKRLSARGVLLVAISKNNEPEVREAFAARRADLALTFDSFAATRINWNDKTRSLQELAGELGLGLESFVVIDDNPVECEEIRRSLPEVEVIEASPDEPWLVLEKLSESGLFDILAITQDDQNRGSEYKAQARRAAAHKTSGGRAEFLSSLGMVCSFQSALQAPISRAVQLLHKTNQFNLTTRRHTEQEVRKFAASGQALAVRVQDRFGDAGVVGLALARYSGITCWIDTLLLSCRVIGRGVETALLAQVGEQAKRDGMTRLVGEFVPTAKNGPCASFYPDHGFTPVALTHAALPGDPVLYELDVTALRGGPCWIAMVETAAEVSRLAEVS